jgi:NAD(P)H-hydrate epimerase
MNQIDSNSTVLGIPRLLLMENAGRAIAEHLKDHFGDLKGRRTVAVAGTGNNGGDSFVAVRHLAGYGASVSVVLLGHDLKTEEASINWRILRNMAKTVRLIAYGELGFDHSLKEEIIGSEIIIDAAFGTGIRGIMKDPYATAIDLINRSNAYIVAVDIPSGLDPLTGEVHDRAVSADTTVTFHRPKTGLAKRPDLTGEVIVMPIGVPPEAETGVFD